MPQIQCKAVLFDLDGVLIDSTRAVARVWHRWAVEHGFDPDEVVARAHGRPSLTTVREYLPNADHAAENREVERREMDDLEGVVLLPGFVAAADGIAAGSLDHRDFLHPAAGRDPSPGGGLACPRTHGHLERHQERKAASRALSERRICPGIFRRRCVVVEDVPAGIRAGKAAGATVIAFRTTVKDAELKAAGADWVLNNCSDIAVGRKIDLTLDLNPTNHVGADALVRPVERSSTVSCRK